MADEGGFTLLETLLVILIFGLVLAMLSQGMNVGIRTMATQTRIEAGFTDLEPVTRSLRRMIGAMDPGTYTEPPVVRGTATSLVFVTDLPLSPDDPPQRADVLLMVADRRLILRWTVAPHAQLFGPPPAVQETVLLEGVDGVEFSYSANGGDWVKVWNLPALPRLVRLRFVFPGADGRRWPTILAASVRERPEE